MDIINLKFCYKCKINKSTIEFSKNRNSKDGLQAHCKSCMICYYKNNYKSISDYQKKYRECNKEKTAEYNKNYRKNNKEKIFLNKKIYRINNKEIISKKKNFYSKYKTKHDPSFKLRKKISLFVRLALNGKKSRFSVLNYLPYSINELKEHLEKNFESWMNWSNWGKYNPATWDDNDRSTWTWQLDHIIPQAHLPYSNMNEENFQKCWSLNNLRPLSAKKNIIDGSKIRSCI